MKREFLTFDDVNAKAEVASFVSEDGVAEFHAMLHVMPLGDDFNTQCSRLHEALKQLKVNALTDAQIVCCRYYLSDAANQMSVLQKYADGNDHTAVIQQPLLDGSKIALWVYAMKGKSAYEHYWDMGATSSEGDSYKQTATLLTNYANKLDSRNLTLANDCIRTWFYVRDVDMQYKGLVLARRKFFTECGLTSDTHYIASTGIGGTPSDAKAIVQMDAYSIGGLKSGQMRYLYAPTHLNRTSEYGVTFERGTYIDYGDRRHVFISGTASINNKGEVVHCGDVVKQTKRMWENVETLLAEADASFNDVAYAIVYLRDIADYAVVSALYAERFPELPYVITLAPVCRPTWLIEMECVAIADRKNPDYKNF